MSESSYEKCHMSHRGYMSNEIGAAREVLRKHKKLCSDSVKELRDKTDMPMSECCDMLRCLWRDAKLERLQAENDKLLELLQRTWDAFHDATACEFVRVKNELRELGVEVTS